MRKVDDSRYEGLCCGPADGEKTFRLLAMMSRLWTVLGLDSARRTQFRQVGAG